MQPIVPITDEGVGNIVPTSMSPPQVPIRSQLSGPGGGGGGGGHHHGGGGVGGGGVGGIQIPTSMEQMTAQATSFLKKIAPTPPTQPPTGPQKDSSYFVGTGPGDQDGEEDRDVIIGGKHAFLEKSIQSGFFVVVLHLCFVMHAEIFCPSLGVFGYYAIMVEAVPQGADV